MNSEMQSGETRSIHLTQDELRKELSTSLVKYLDQTNGTLRWYSAYEEQEGARYADIHFDPELEGFHWALTFYTKKLAHFENEESRLYKKFAREKGEDEIERDDVFQAPHVIVVNDQSVWSVDTEKLNAKIRGRINDLTDRNPSVEKITDPDEVQEAIRKSSFHRMLKQRSKDIKEGKKEHIPAEDVFEDIQSKSGLEQISPEEHAARIRHELRLAKLNRNYWENEKQTCHLDEKEMEIAREVAHRADAVGDGTDEPWTEHVNELEPMDKPLWRRVTPSQEETLRALKKFDDKL